MSSVLKALAETELHATALFGLPPDVRALEIERIREEAAAHSKFKIGQLVRVERPGALRLADWSEAERPADDPYKYFDSRVTGFDTFGRIQIAIGYGENPHCCEWPWSEEMIATRDDVDWADTSPYHIDMRVLFIWELSGFSCAPNVGTVLEARLRVPHIESGEWVIHYARPSDGGFNTRALHESQMTLVSACDD